MTMKKHIRIAIKVAATGSDASVLTTMPPTPREETHMPTDPHIKRGLRPHRSIKRIDKKVAVTFMSPVTTVVVSGSMPIELKIMEE